MNSKLSFTVVLLLIHAANARIAPSFWDGIPVVSQIKSVVQVIVGDIDGARRTQVNFMNRVAPIILQIKSLVEAKRGDAEAAKKTQELLREYLDEPLVPDDTSILSHNIKGSIHIAADDKEREEQILEDASSSTGIKTGGLFEEQSRVDSLITGVDYAVNNQHAPYGLVEYYVENIDENSPEDYLDQ